MPSSLSRRACLSVLLAGWASTPWLAATYANENLGLAPQAIFDFVSAGSNRPAVVTAVAVSADGRYVAAGGDDHTIRIYDASNHTVLHELTSHRDWVRGLAFSPTGDRLVSVGSDHTHLVFDVATGDLLGEHRGGEGPLRAVAFNCTGDKLAAVGYHSSALVCGPVGDIVQQMDCPCRDTHAVAFSGDGQRLAVAGRDGQLRVFDTINTSSMPLTIAADSRRIRTIAFSPDGTRVATGGDGAEVKFFDTSTGELATSWPCRPAKVFCLKYLDHNRLAMGGSDNTVHVWNVASQTIERQLVGHSGTVATLAADETGNILATGGFDTTVRVWNLGATAPSLTAERGTATVR